MSVFNLASDAAAAMKTVAGQLRPINCNDAGEVIGTGISIFASPVYANGTLYIASRSHLAAIAKLPENPTTRQGYWPQWRGPQRDNVSPDKGRVSKGSPSVFVPTPQDVVEKMLQVAQVTQQDVVYDLGSGDGRIVITAAKKYGSRGVGIEIDQELVEISRAKSQEFGVAHLVRFEQGNIFEIDFSEATVVMAYLLPQQLEKLVPQFRRLKPGSRIVSHNFVIPGLEPSGRIAFDSAESGEQHQVYFWRTPLDDEK